jgi:hypothetical protein
VGDKIKQFVSAYMKKAHALCEKLAEKGGNVASVNHCITGVQSYLAILSQLNNSATADVYEPNMSELLTEIAKPASKLHYRDNVFGEARRLCKIYSEDLHEVEMGAFATGAYEMDAAAEMLAQAIMRAKERSRQP